MNASEFTHFQAMKRILKIPVCGFPLFHFENMNDQDIIVNGEQGTNISSDPERINRVGRVGCLQFLNINVGSIGNFINLPDCVLCNIPR